MKITIAVTQEDIDHGVPMESCHCPIARALARQVPGAPEVNVFSSEVSFERGGRWGYNANIPLPDEAKRFIEQFDASPMGIRDFPGPIEFELDIPDELAPAGESR